MRARDSFTLSPKQEYSWRLKQIYTNQAATVEYGARHSHLSGCFFIKKNAFEALS
jgi:hypothetical protein